MSMKFVCCAVSFSMKRMRPKFSAFAKYCSHCSRLLEGYWTTHLKFIKSDLKYNLTSELSDLDRTAEIATTENANCKKSFYKRVQVSYVLTF